MFFLKQIWSFREGSGRRGKRWGQCGRSRKEGGEIGGEKEAVDKEVWEKEVEEEELEGILTEPSPTPVSNG